MIIEGLLTTLDQAGSVNVAAMGPIVDATFSDWLFRPFPESCTYSNLLQTRCGVFHVTDDVLLLVQAALDEIESSPPMRPAERIRGTILEDCCRWYEIAVDSVSLTGERPEFRGRTISSGRARDFVGFNRARHAVIEAAIIASRLRWLAREMVVSEIERLESPVLKTGGPRELKAFELVRNHIRSKLEGVTPDEA